MRIAGSAAAVGAINCPRKARLIGHARTVCISRAKLPFHGEGALAAEKQIAPSSPGIASLFAHKDGLAPFSHKGSRLPHADARSFLI